MTIMRCIQYTRLQTDIRFDMDMAYMHSRIKRP